MIAKFKNAQAEREYHLMPKKLREICEFFEACCGFYYITPVVTRVREDIVGDSDVHKQGRAIDYRDETVLPDGRHVFLFNTDQVAQICELIAARYPRSDGRPVVLHHSFNRGPSHFHFQIPYAWLLPGEPRNS